jgi:uncharacterized protein
MDGVPVRPQLVILQPTALCNLNCRYCYLPDRKDSGGMSDEVLQASARFVFACELSGGEVEFLWHAGEPLAAGLEFYKRAFALFAKEAPAGLRIRHVIQTNGTLLTRQWCELFSQYHVQVGLSVDGPAEIHDQNRRTWGDKGTHAKVMRGYELLRRSGIRAGAICVLTRESLRWPDRIYDFFKEAGFASVAFNVEESEGVYLRSGLLEVKSEDIRDLYELFMRRIWQRWREDKQVITIREFKQMLGCIQRLHSDENFVRQPPEVTPFTILTIRKDGGMSTFSPELASTPNERYENFVLGNVLTDTPNQVAEGARFARLFEDVAEGQRKCRESCEHYALCGAGFQSNRLTEHGTFHATETLTCRLHRKTLADVILDELIKESRNQPWSRAATAGEALAGQQQPGY